MTNVLKCLAGVYLFFCFAACSDKKDRDDSVLDMNLLTAKDWYYNGWLGEKYSFGDPDLLEVLRFEKGGTLKVVDFSGRREYVAGQWDSGENKINLHYTNGNTVVWNVMHSGTDYIQTIVNAQGERKYTTDLGYLENLTADAFLVNEYTSGNRFRTRLGVTVQGNVNMREGAAITAAGQVLPLVYRGYYWGETSSGESSYFDFDHIAREVRFYIRIGKDTPLKLRDSLYGENLPQRYPSEVALKASVEAGVATVSWEPYSSPRVFYRVEIFPDNMDLTQPYFVSRIQPAQSSEMKIRVTTGGELNRIQELESGKTYAIRLSALLYEPGVDVVNDEYNYANLQAVTYFTDVFVWK